MKQLEFTTLKLFIAVAETGSLSAAAEQHCIAVGAVSKRVSDLEYFIGSKLFERHARGVRVTQPGRELLQHAREIMYGVDRMFSGMSQYSRGIKGRVRVAATGTAVSEFLPADLKSFGDTHHNIHIELVEWTSQRIIDAVLEGHVDMGIFIGPNTSESVVAFPYRIDELCLAVPLGHPLADRDGVSFDDVVDYDFIGLEPQSSISQAVVAEGGPRLKTRINVRSSDALCRMVAQGLGIGVAPLMIVEAHSKALPICAVALRTPWSHRQMLIGVRSEEGLSAAARLFLDHCRSSASRPSQSASTSAVCSPSNGGPRS